MRKVTCAGCDISFDVSQTCLYRNKRWCNNIICKNVIDEKVKTYNYKRRQNKINNGTYRHGVTQELRKTILDRDSHTCSICKVISDDFGKMQVHHIVPVSHDGSDDDKNLVTVCKSCHAIVHKGGWENYVVSLKKNIEKVERLTHGIIF